MNAPAQHPPGVRTTCPYCGVGCGVLAAPDGRGGAGISGDPSHPSNFGKLCSKGTALGETLGLDGRLLHPMLRKDGALQQVDWNTALGAAADGLRRTIWRHGAGAVAFYLSGQLLTEDYYVANKLMKGFIGSSHVDTNSRLCMASSVAGHRRAFGADTVPGIYADLDEADLLVLVGSNAAWCHPVLFQRMIANKRKRGAKIVVIDPRRTASAEDADLFLPVAPGMDTALFCGLLVHLAGSGVLDRRYIGTHTSGFDVALARAEEIAPSAAAAAQACGLAEADVARFYELFKTTERVVTCFSQGVNQSAQGTDKVNVIINCHLATGRIGRPGMGPFSLTGQPNAMGGREVGGLANQLAAHMDFTPDAVERVGRFWNALNMANSPGLKAVQMFDAIERGQIKALWVMATNPAVSLPRAGAVREALKKLDLLIISENVVSNDTVNVGAHILLPAAAWGEKGGTVTNSERRVSRQRQFLPLPGEVKPDWWIVTQVAQRMGFTAQFPYQSAADIFREHAALSAFENEGARDFDLGALADVSDEAYDALEPVQWPARKGAPKEERRHFAEGGFFTPDRKARFIAPEAPVLKEKTSAKFPLRLNTGRVRDQWHTMTRTGQSPRLAAHLPEPFVEVNPQDATTHGLSDGAFARIATPYGACTLRVRVQEGQRRGSLFVPIHWSDSNASSARVGELVMPATDPHSGQPEAKATPAAITPVVFASCGFVLSRRAITLPSDTWWARVAVTGGEGYLIATNQASADWQAWARALLGDEVDIAEYADAPRGICRMAGFVHGRLEFCSFVGLADAPPSWDAIKALIENETIAERQRRILLSGRSADGLSDPGPLVCACFGVGLNTIREALASGTATSVETIGTTLRAGTNCGSCLPELKRIVSREHTANPV